MTIHATLTGPVAADLAKHGLTLVLSAGGQTRGDAWCDATARHGERVAVIHLTDGSWNFGRPRFDDWGEYVDARALYVDFPRGDVAAGAAIRDTLVAHGFTVDWTGEAQSAVIINLRSAS